MSLVKTLSRKVIFPLITGMGIEKYFSLSSGNSHLILCYHGSSHAPDFSINGRHMESRQLEAHFAYFKKNYNVLSLDEMFINCRENKRSPKRSIAITFDDGYLNNYTTVFPLIKKYNIPASFFILSKPSIDETFINWPDIIDIIKKYSDCKVIEIGNQIFKRKDQASFFSESLNLYISDYIKKMGAERDELLSRSMEQCGFEKLLAKANAEYYKFINRGQLIEMSKNPLVEIGSHTHSHFNLGNIDLELAKTELVSSKKILEDIIGKEVSTIAFPDGSYNNEVKNISESAGYKNQVAVSYQCPDDKPDGRILPRMTISNTTTFESNMIQVNLGFRKRGF